MIILKNFLLRKLTVLLFLLLFFQIAPAQTKNDKNGKLKKIITFKDGVVGYKIKVGKPSDSMEITFLKNSSRTQLNKVDDQTLWLGMYDEYIRYFENPTYSVVTIIFSKPVTSIDFLLSHFNSDRSGYEDLRIISVSDLQSNDITSSTQFKWTTGASSGTDSSSEGATILRLKPPSLFDRPVYTISAKEGHYGASSGGRLSIYNSIAFTQIELKQKVISGKPNGILINTEINCTLSVTEPSVIENKKSDSVITTIKTDTLNYSPNKLISKIDTIQKLDSTNSKQSLLVNTILDTTSVTLIKEINIDSLHKKLIPITKITNSITSHSKVVKKQPVSVSNKKPIAKSNIQKLPSKKVVVNNKPKTITNNKTELKKQIKQKTVVKKYTKITTINKKTVSIKKTETHRKTEMIHELKHVANVKVGEIIKLENVFFKQSLPELLPESYPQLDTLVLILNQYPSMEIEIQGHTDNQGKAELNLILSEERATAVKDYLVYKGIATNRLTQKGFGGTRPLVDNGIAAHRNQNRRVEFMITKR